MRTSTLFIFAYVMLGMQLGVSRFIMFHGSAPNFGLIAALLVAMNGRRDSAPLACVGIGLAQDLLSEQQIGVYAFSYGIVALAILTIRQMGPRHLLLRQFLYALLAGSIVTLVVLTHSAIHPAAPALPDEQPPLPAVRISAAAQWTGVIYTAVATVICFGALERVRSLFSAGPSKVPQRR